MSIKKNGKESYCYNLSDIETSSKIAKALSSEIRLKILKLLVESSMSMSELSQKLFVSMSSISMHIKILKEANLVTVSPKPGMHGAQKVCGIKAEKITFDFFNSYNDSINKTLFFDIPIGSYSDININSPCGIIDTKNYIDTEDTLYGFYSPNRINAQLLWFSSGYLNYKLSNKFIKNINVKSVSISFEICSESPGYNNKWPSDISLIINNKNICQTRLSGDYGGTRGINNPSWWPDSNTQFGEFKILSIRNDGSYLNGKYISKETIKSLNLSNGFYFDFSIGIDESSEFVGGLNLFGNKFGNYSQGIGLTIKY